MRPAVKLLAPFLAAFSLAAVFLAPPAAAQQDIVDQFERREGTLDGFTLPYRLFVPAGYDTTRAYPLVLALHGAGERGTDNEVHIARNGLAIPWAEPERQAEHPAFVVAPQVPPGLRWAAEQPVASSDFTPLQRTVLAILDSLGREFNIDPDRVYVVGLSMGGHGTWDFASRAPERFAAAVPMSGRGYTENAGLLMDMPIWAFHGETDGVVPPSETRRVVQALEDRGRRVLYTHCRRAPVQEAQFDCPGAVSQDSIAAAIEDHVDLLLTSERNVGHGPWGPWFENDLMADWLFSKHRRTPDAIAIDAPAGGTAWAGEQAVTWTSAQTPTDTVEVWVSLDGGATWGQAGTATVGDGAFPLDTDAYPDTPLARVRLFVVDAEGFVYGLATSEAFAIDNAGNAAPYLTIDDEALRFASAISAEALRLELVAADAEGDALTAEVYYSIDGGGTAAQVATVALASSPEPQEIEVDLVPLPNSAAAQFRVVLSDGAGSATDTTAVFAKVTPRTPGPNAVEQVAGDGSGTVRLRIVDPTALTRHRYRVEIDAADPDAKTYAVRDLDLGQTVLAGVPFSDGVRESPLFDGLTLVVEDLAEGAPDLAATGWVEGDTDLGVAIAGGTVAISVLIVDLLATETDYDLTVTEAVADTSVAAYALPARPLYFEVTGRADGRQRDVAFDDDDGDGRLGDDDVLYILEPDAAGEPAPAWRFTFSAGTVPPEPGDVFRFVPLRSLSDGDAFEFVGTDIVGADEGPGAGVGLRLAGYPNPFRHRAVLTYELPAAAAVTLEVFDVLGRRVAVLADRVHEAGRYDAAWDGAGASGVFYVRLTARPVRGGAVQRVQQALTRLR